MAENQSNEANAQQQSQQQEPDYKALYEQLKADARKWEDRAKANKQKADKYDEMSAGNTSVEERIAALEAENKAMKDAAAHAQLVAKVASATALPEALVATLSGSDEETLTAQAQAISALKPKGAPSAPEAGKFPRDTNADEDAEMKQFVRDLFGESK